MQRPHKENLSLSNGKTKCGNSVNFDGNVKEVKIVEHNDPTPRKNMGEKLAKNRKSESAKAYPEEVKCTYVIDRLNIDEAKNDLDDYG